MWVVATGGRLYTNAVLVYETLSACGPEVLVQGGAEGADAHARSWAKLTSTPCFTVWADWKTGKRAGPIRNGRMLNLALRSAGKNNVRVVAFPGNTGTSDCVRQAEGLGLKVIRIGWET